MSYVVFYELLSFSSFHSIHSLPFSDSLAGIPYTSHDPFILSDLPDVYVVGNQPSFMTARRVIGGKEVLLIALPSFASTGTVVMVNVRSLAVEPICFDTSEMEGEGQMEVEEKEEEVDVVIEEDNANEDN